MRHVLLVGCAALLLLSCRSQQPEGTTNVNEDRLAERLRALAPTDENALDALAAEITAEALRLPRAAVRVWLSPDGESGQKAMYVLGSLGDTALPALLETQPPLPPDREAWLLRTVVQEHVELRQKLVERLRVLLDDTRIVPEPASEAMEEVMPAYRVCDEAMVQLRRFAEPDESVEAYQIWAREYLHKPEPRRDAEIRRVKSAPIWKRFAEELE